MIQKIDLAGKKTYGKYLRTLSKGNHTMVLSFHGEAPLAERMRPRNLEEVAGQYHLIGEGKILKKAVEMGQVPSLILWGPPGVGKTTLATIIAEAMKSPMYILSAISSGVKELREVIDKCKYSGKGILFIDEIHRFNKTQQDALLAAVEKGWLTLIGATTENPSFEVNKALLSRCQVYKLDPLTKEDLKNLLNRAITKDVQLAKRNIRLQDTEALISLSGGDARKLLNLLEAVVLSNASEELTVTDELVMNTVQQKTVLYDKSGEQHYDIISAFIKSIRGSDPNAGVYWLARMLEGGEDIKFIARRLVILASEDIGNANPTALVMASSAFDAIIKIGMPEAAIILSQVVTYLASSPKSNASYLALHKAQSLVHEKGNLEVPIALRNAPTKLMKDMGYGQGYKYSHDYEGGFAEQEFLPEEIKGTDIYKPGNTVRENELRSYLAKRWKGKYGYDN
ncbi:MAG TPA: replication-associated recombination protein A [Cytophagaceae bacterium]|jgi:putative ATPase|nr:replication-associated recombination protein A [Cytophagaceae bacterium]